MVVKNFEYLKEDKFLYDMRERKRERESNLKIRNQFYEFKINTRTLKVGQQRLIRDNNFKIE